MSSTVVAAIRRARPLPLQFCVLILGLGSAALTSHAQVRSCGDEFPICPFTLDDVRMLQDDVRDYHDRYIVGWERQRDRAVRELESRRLKTQALRQRNAEAAQRKREVELAYQRAQASLNATGLNDEGVPLQAIEARAAAEAQLARADEAFQQAYQAAIGVRPDRPNKAAEAGNKAARPYRQEARRFDAEADAIERRVAQWKTTVETSEQRIESLSQAMTDREEQLAELLDPGTLQELQQAADEARTELARAEPWLRDKQRTLDQARQVIGLCISYRGLQGRHQELKLTATALGARNSSLRCDVGLPPLSPPVSWAADDLDLYMASCRVAGREDGLGALGCLRR